MASTSNRRVSTPAGSSAVTNPTLEGFGVPLVSTITAEVHPLPGVKVGIRLDRDACNAAWASSARKYVDGGSTSRISGLYPREFLMTSDGYIEFRDAARRMIDTGLTSTSLLGRFSSDVLSKWMPENGSPFGWYAPPLLNFAAQKEPPFNAAILAWLRRKTYDNWPSFQAFVSEMKLRVPTDSGHGAPTFGTGLEDLFAHMGLASEILASGSIVKAHALVREANILCRMPALDNRAALVTHSRSGPMKKPTPTRFFSGGVLSEGGSTVGLFCRRRHVRGVSTWFNEVMRAPVMWAQMGLKRWEGFSHGRQDSMDEKFRRTLSRAREWGPVQILSDDASNFDDTISLRHLLQLKDQVYLWPEILHEWAYSESLSIPVLSGPMYEGDVSHLSPRLGGVASGLVTTTMDDTLINICCVVSSISVAAKKSIPYVLSAIDSGELGIWVQGDDTLLFTSWDIDRDVYTDTAKSFGYIRKIEDFPIFLMRWYEGSTSFGSSMRAACRTATRESRALGPHFERFGTYNRWLGVQGDPLLDASLWCAQSLPYSRDELTNPLKFLSSSGLIEGMKGEMAGPQGVQKSIKLVRELLARGVTNEQFTILRRIGLIDIYEKDAVFSDGRSSYDWRTHFRGIGAAGDDDFVAAGRT